jgi:hypothetical protein
MTQKQIDALNAQMTDGKTAHDVAVENNLELAQWYDQSGGLYVNTDGAMVFGWEGTVGVGGFDDQVPNVIL